MTPVSDQSQRVARNFFWLSLQEVMIRLLGLAIAIYLARKFSPADYGALGIALAIVGFLGVMVSEGTAVRATRLTALDHSTIPHTFAVVSGIRVTAVLISIACLLVMAPSAAGVMSVPPALLVLTGLRLSRPALSVEWAFKGQDRMDVFAAGEILEKGVFFLGLIVFVQGGHTQLLRVPLVEAVAALVLVYLFYNRLERDYSPLRFRFNLSEWPQFLRESIPVTLATLMSLVLRNGGVILLGLLMTSDAAGIFLVSQKVMLTVLTLFLVVNGSAFPTISRLMTGKLSEAMDLQANLLRLFFAAAIPLTLLVGFHAAEVLGLLFGKAYSSESRVLVILLCALPSIIFAQGLQNVLLASANPRPILIAKSCGAVTMLVLLVVLIPMLGTSGAALALLGGELINMWFLIAGTRLNLRSTLWSRATSGTVAAGVVMALSLMFTGDWPAAQRIPLAVSAYLGAIYLFRGVSLRELGALPRLLSAVFRPNENVPVREEPS